MIIKENFLIIGDGQAGGNIAQLFENKNYPVLAINTSREDLDTLTIKHKYHIIGGEGCSKDRSIGRKLIRNDYVNILKQIENCGKDAQVIVIVGSAGGGTASSTMAVLADMLTLDPKYKDVIICMVVILPSDKESVQANSNAYCCFKEIAALERTGACFVLDNKEFEDKMEINKQFVDYFDEFLHIPMSDKSIRGNIDFSEIKKTLSAHNMAVMAAVPQCENVVAELLDSLQNNSIFAHKENDTIIQYTALSLADENLSAESVNKELQKAIGTPIDNFTTYNKRKRNFICLSGLSYPQTRLNEIEDIVTSNRDNITKSLTASLELNADMSFLQKTATKQDATKADDKPATIEDIFNKYDF